MKSITETLLCGIRRAGRPVVIVGAGVVGGVLLSLLTKAGIKVDFFCDSSEKVATQKKFCGLDIVHITQIPKSHRSADFIISAASIRDVVERLRGETCFHWYAGGHLLKDIDVSQPDATLDYAKFAIENCILCHDGYLYPDKLFLRSIDLIITERCSLRCKDCSNLMQYYEQPRDCDTDVLLRSIDAFCTVVDEVMDFRVIGGEVFINKDWPVIVERLVKEPKARRVVLYTNATIMPPRRYIKLLQHKKVLVIASDYGALSRNLSRMTDMFLANDIAHHVLTVTEWLSCSAIAQHFRSRTQNIELFKLCCAKNMASLSDGKLFRCPYSANAFRLGAVPDHAGDYVDLLNEPLGKTHLDATRRKVRDYLLQKLYLHICDYCNGRPLSGVEAKPFVQTDRPLPYQRYR